MYWASANAAIFFNVRTRRSNRYQLYEIERLAIDQLLNS